MALLPLNDMRKAMLVGLVAGGCIMLLLQNVFTSMGSSPSKLNNGFGLYVGLTFKNDVAKRDFKDFFKPFAEYVEKNEHDTLAYMYMDNDKDASRALIVERYRSPNAYHNIHKKSQAFTDFRTLLMRMQNKGDVSVDGQSYLESTLGFFR